MSERDVKLETLIRDLNAEPSAAGRLRLIGRAWPFLSVRSSSERHRVVRVLGEASAGQWFERLFDPNAKLTPWERALRSTLGRVAEAPPTELRQLAKTIRLGRRVGLQGSWATLMVEVLEREAEEREAEQLEAEKKKAAEAATGEDGAEEEPEEAQEPATVSAPEEHRASAAAVKAGSTAALLAGLRRIAHQEPAASSPAEFGPAPPEASSASPEPTASPTPQASTPAPNPAPTPAPNPAPTQPAPNISPDPPNVQAQVEVEEAGTSRQEDSTAEPAPEVPTRSADQPPKASPAPPPPAARTSVLQAKRRRRAPRGDHPFEVLLRLNHDPHELRTAGSAGRQRLIAGLSGSWAARRAVQRIIQSGGYGTLSEALSLISALPSPTDRTWCLLDLVEHGSLSPVEARSVVAAAPSPSASRRLEARLRAHAARLSQA